jgi:hypothetical protein
MLSTATACSARGRAGPQATGDSAPRRRPTARDPADRAAYASSGACGPGRSVAGIFRARWQPCPSRIGRLAGGLEMNGAVIVRPVRLTAGYKQTGERGHAPTLQVA